MVIRKRNNEMKKTTTTLYNKCKKIGIEHNEKLREALDLLLLKKKKK